jgi:RNA polymerase sigma-70 factor, ECF subfamily
MRQYALVNPFGFKEANETMVDSSPEPVVRLGSLTDAQLVQRSKTGEREAFGELVRRWQNLVFSLCRNHLSDKALAEELTQEVFLSAFRAISGFRGQAKFSTWLVRITINHCRNAHLYHFRRRRGSHEPLEGSNPDFPRQLPTNAPTAEDDLAAKDMKRLLEEGLAKLPDPHRIVILMRDLQGLSYEEIAADLDLPLGTVKSRLHRARCELANALKGKITPSDLE